MADFNRSTKNMPFDPESVRADFISEFAGLAKRWTAYGEDFVRNPQPAKPFLRPSSDLAQRDKTFREAFACMPENQKEKVIALLRECVFGSVFSSLVTLDQFAVGEVVISIRSEDSGESVQIAPTDVELHDDYAAQMKDFP